VSKQPNKQTEPLPQQPQADPIQVKLNRMSVKFNAKQMLEQEFGESLSDFINTATQLIGELSAQVAKLEAEQKAKEPKTKQ